MPSDPKKPTTDGHLRRVSNLSNIDAKKQQGANKATKDNDLRTGHSTPGDGGDNRIKN